jgi:hypothetical protein
VGAAGVEGDSTEDVAGGVEGDATEVQPAIRTNSRKRTSTDNFIFQALLINRHKVEPSLAGNMPRRVL